MAPVRTSTRHGAARPPRHDEVGRGAPDNRHLGGLEAAGGAEGQHHARARSLTKARVGAGKEVDQRAVLVEQHAA
jgi:hypothetical protein